MKCLVTGGAGFIGSHIAEELLCLGHEVTVIDDLSAGKRENVPEGAKLVVTDVLNINSRPIQQTIGHIDVVFHNAASKKNICLKDPMRDCDVNTKGTLAMLTFAYETGVKKFIHASTGSIYGERSDKLREWDKPAPVSYYGVSKANGEQYVQYFNEKGLNTTILRYFHVYGPRQESDENLGGVVSIFIDKMKNSLPLMIHGTGTQDRSFTFVKDVVKANLLVMDHPEANGEIFNCASGDKINIFYLITELRKHLPFTKYIMGDRLEGDIDKFDIDNLKLRALGLKYIPFSEGIELTI